MRQIKCQMMAFKSFTENATSIIGLEITKSSRSEIGMAKMSLILLGTYNIEINVDGTELYAQDNMN